METPAAYIPMDRLHALAQGVELPQRTQGAALFADISGFTPLTETLVLEFGPKRGAEELSVHLNQVYDALIDELHRYGGSVLTFSGDAITCWIEGDDGRRAVACGMAMQAAMRPFSEVRTASGRAISLGVKVAIAVGPARRFIVGDPEYGLMDALAGRTLDRMAAGEGIAERGEVVLDEPSAEALADLLQVSQWREDEETGDRFAVVVGLNAPIPAAPWPALPEHVPTEEHRRAWLLPAVNERIQGGEGEFLAELRPAVALFLRFTGIRFDDDEDAPQKLDTFIREAQQVVARYGGNLLQLTFGDKGSYLYAAFGAPVAHEDDPTRACSAALDLHELALRLDDIDPIQVGITQGRMRTGAYGAAVRRTYGVLGDAANLAARLMGAARPGQTIASEISRSATGDAFTWESLGSIRVKGKGEPIPVLRLLGVKAQRAMRLQEPRYRLPMVGRQAELAAIADRIDRVTRGHGQIVGIAAEAGMGKSRLAAEVIRLAQARGLAGLGGECQSYGSNTPYLVWHNVWRGFFGVDPDTPLDGQIRRLAAQVGRMGPSFAPRLPLLGPALNLPIPDNDLTEPLDAKVRKSALEALLVDCLRARVTRSPLLIVLEDCHWLDALSYDLIGVIGRAIADMPILMLLLYRPPDRERRQAPPVDRLPHFTELALTNFTPEEAERLIDLKLRQFFGEDMEPPADFVRLVTDRAAGNPFYIEEIVNYLRDVDVDPRDTERLRQLDLPTSIYSLILSRIDQLEQQQQIAIRVASVIGRLFPAAMLWGVYPALGNARVVQHALDLLSELELTSLDQPAPEMTYLFKHIVTQQVAYETLPYATRATLHAHIGEYIETTYADSLDQRLNLLAFHYDRGNNESKRREYLRRAAEAAHANYANSAAIDYFERLLPLLEGPEQGAAALKLGITLDTVGQYAEADTRLGEALALAQAGGDRALEAQCEVAIGELRRKQSRYDEAEVAYQRAETVSRELGDQAGVAKALICAGSLLYFRGQFADAQRLFEQTLTIRRAMNDRPNIANALNNLGIVRADQDDFEQAMSFLAEALTIRRTLGDKWAIPNSLNNLGQLALIRGDYAQARVYLEEALALQREIGVKSSIAHTGLNLGNVLRALGEHEAARAVYQDSLVTYRELGDRRMIAYLLEDIGGLLALQGDSERALRLAGAASLVRESLNLPLSAADQRRLDEALEPARQALGEAAAARAWNAGRDLPLDDAMAEALAVSAAS